MESALIQALRRAVDAAPDDVPLRLHVAEQLEVAGDQPGALDQIAAALRVDPASTEARSAMARVLSGTREDAPPPEAADGSEQVPGPRPEPRTDFDWAAAEQQVADLAEPMFVNTPPPTTTRTRSRPPTVRSRSTADGSRWSNPT